MFKTSFYVLLFLTLIISVSGSALAVEGTIVTKAGDKYENVDFKTNHLYQIISFKSEGWKVNVSYTDIVAIYDMDGKDITKKTLGRYYRPEKFEKTPVEKGETPGDTTRAGAEKTDSEAVPVEDVADWRSENDEEIAVFRKKLWSVGLSGGPRYSIPTGDYYDGIDPGVGFGGALTLAVSHNIALRCSIAKVGLGWGYDEVSFKSMRYMFSLMYYDRVNRLTLGKKIFYLITGLGAVSHDASYQDLGYSETKFTAEMGGGLIQLFSEKVGMDFSLLFNLVYVGTYDDGDTSRMQTALIIELKASLIGLF